MLHILRRGSSAVLWVVIIGVGGVFVLYLGFQGGFSPAAGSGPWSGPVSFSFDGRDLERVRQGMEARYREALGEQFDPEAAARLPGRIGGPNAPSLGPARLAG